MLLRNVGVYAVNEKGKCGLLKYNGMPLNAKPSFFNIDKPEFAKSFEDTTLYCDSANWEHRRILPKLINKPDESRIITWHDLENKMMPACESVEYFFYCKYVDYTEKNEQENLGRKGQFIDFPGYLYVLACKRPLSTVEVFDLLHNLEAINLSGRDALFVLDNMVKNPLRFLVKQITKVDTRIESIHRETDKIRMFFQLGLLMKVLQRK